MPDTGAVWSLTGISNVLALEAEALAAGFPGITWERLAHPRMVSGVGGSSEPCLNAARMQGVLKDGSTLRYSAPVVERDAQGQASDLPSLIGNADLAKLNALYDCKSGYLHLLPQNATWRDIVWPAGTTHLEMDRAPSGRWVFTVSSFECSRTPAPGCRPRRGD